MSRADRLRTGLACVSTGVALCASLPPFGFWPLAFVGLIGLDWLLADRPWRARFVRGAAVGLALYVPSLVWMQALTLPGYLIACVLYAAILGGAATAAPPGPGRWPALVGAWTLAELLRWTWPFGGVPLSNLAVGQVAGPLAPVARVGGSLLVVTVTVLVGQALAAAVRGRARSAIALAAVALLLVSGAAVAPDGHPVGDAEVALVQGGGQQGARKEETGVVVPFERHVDATAGVREPVDLVVWPEDVIDTEGAFVDHPWAEVVGRLARGLDAPMVVGTVEGADTESFVNGSVLVSPDGEAIDRYDKVHRVPFGEYVPFRSLLELVADEALPDRDARIGERPARLDVPGAVGRVSVSISWEVFFADRTREGVEDGARLVLNPTNGASFTGTIVQSQQVASSRLRAIENGRWVMQVAPTGFTAVVDDRGRVVERSSVGERRVIQRTVDLREGLTIYTRVGNAPAVALALVLLAIGWAWDRRSAG
ncbi:MAG: apolipoprotein N-acyltransferase [Acidimicrobiales bacterium]|nr:apolipoprotein N-acyltransferase [Acidimicrobiales bacterium]